MIVFAYKAVTAGGELVDSRLEAADKASLVRRLNELGYLPIRAEALQAGLAIAKAEMRLPWAARSVSRKDLTLITRELATLMGARCG